MHTSSKNFRTSLFAAVLALVTLSPAMHAQGSAVRAEAKVPFAFEVGSAHFEAGTYTIDDLATHLLEVRSGLHSALTVTRQETSFNPATSGKIVFRKYGDKYFMAEVWTKGETEHVTIIKSKAEETVRKMQLTTASIAPGTRTEVALLQGPK